MKSHTLSDVFNFHITVYWWNLGKKTLDFRGSAYNYFKEKKIKVRRLPHPNHADIIQYHFYMLVGSAHVKLILTYDAVTAAAEAIKIYNSILGNRTELSCQYKYAKINWR